jgi:hypothetical protein
MSLKRILKKLILEKLGYVEEDLITSPYDTDVDKPRVPIISLNDTNKPSSRVPIVSSSQSNLLDLTKPLDNGFCKYNPQINQYAQSGPDELAEMIIFVIATQQQRWYDVVPKFPILMAFLRKNGRLIDPSLDYQDIPIAFSQLALGFRRDGIDTAWTNRDQYYSILKPLINKYNKSSGIAKEDAMFSIYLECLKIPALGYPKAAFATQLIIGRLGCIDSINLNLYKDLDKENTIISKSGGFKTPDKIKDSNNKVIDITKGTVKLAKEYVAFLKRISELTKSSEAQISQMLWDSWVKLVELKINQSDDIDVIMPGGEKFVVPNDYARKTSDADTNPSSAFRKKYIGNITADDISRQHYPPMMTEGFKKWTKYFYKTLNN